jgi:hypothetical protein
VASHNLTSHEVETACESGRLFVRQAMRAQRKGGHKNSA